MFTGIFGLQGLILHIFFHWTMILCVLEDDVESKGNSNNKKNNKYEL